MLHRTRTPFPAALAALAIAMTVVVTSEAPAAADTPPDLADFQLRPTDLDLHERADQLAAVIPPASVGTVLDGANRSGSQGTADEPCNVLSFDAVEGPALGGPPPHQCWDDADTGQVDGDEDGAVEWMPQGLTTAADASADEQVDGKQPVIVSWYDKRLAPEKGVRVSFFDPATQEYRHVLLVYPYTNQNGDPSYEIVDSPQSGDNEGLHAGGIAWYGDRLYVADTERGIRVFDMRYVLDLRAAADGDTDDASQVGLHGGTYYGFGYRYVMPQVDAWVNDAGADNDGDSACEPTGAPKFSYLGVDRTSEPDRLVSGEYCRNADGAVDRNGRAATWPLDEATGDPATGAGGVWRANEAQRLPAPNIQGAVVVDGRWFLSRSRGESNNGLLIEAAGQAPAGTLEISSQRWGGVGVEDLSYWPSQDAIWTVTEHPGRRALYSCPVQPQATDELCGTAPARAG